MVRGSPDESVRSDLVNVANILLVDDRSANLITLEAILDPLKQRTVRANSGAEALDRLRTGEYAVVLMDVQMPNMDGLKTAELMKRDELTAHVPIIFLTAAGVETSDMMRGYERGAVDFLLKPFEPEILRSKVSVFVDLFLKEQMIRRQAAELRAHEREALERHSELRFRALIDAMPQCVWAARTDATFYYWNQQASSFTGEPAAPISLEKLLDSVHPDDRAALAEAWQRVLSGEQFFELKARLSSSENQTIGFRWHLIRGLTQRADKRLMAGWILVATDIDAEQQALEQAETANRMKDEFLATVSHELRNPLNSISGWLHLLRTGNLDKVENVRALDTIERNVQLQSSLINDILDVSQVTRGRIQLNMKSLALTAVLKAALTSIKPAAEAKEIDLRCDIDLEGDGFVRGDEDRLQQVIWNLLSNAVKFTPCGGSVTVRLYREGLMLNLMVSDTGQGISPAFLPFVFDKFRQADSSTTRTHSGLGLGLAIVRHLVEVHGGDVRAQSDGAEKGATFTIRLPETARGSESRSTAPRANGCKSLSDVRLLLVEDDDDSREVLSEVLRGYGATVLATASCREAIDKMGSFRPTVLLSDIGMPREDGISLIKRVREEHSGEKVAALALTGFDGTNDRKRALEAGFDAFVVKPVLPDRLVESIRDLLAANGAEER